MSGSTAIVNFDSEFRLPPDCLREGDVDCRVVQAACEIIHAAHDWVTFKIWLLLKIRIRSGRLVCTFLKEIVLKDTVWLDCNTWIHGCEVVAAVCRCVVHRGKIHCSGAVKVRFLLRKKWEPACCCTRPHGSRWGCHGSPTEIWEGDCNADDWCDDDDRSDSHDQSDSHDRSGDDDEHGNCDRHDRWSPGKRRSTCRSIQPVIVKTWQA